jgi:hypothetical protein
MVTICCREGERERGRDGERERGREEQLHESIHTHFGNKLADTDDLNDILLRLQVFFITFHTLPAQVIARKYGCITVNNLSDKL